MSTKMRTTPWSVRLNWTRRWVSKCATLGRQRSQLNRVLRNYNNSNRCSTVLASAMNTFRPRLSPLKSDQSQAKRTLHCHNRTKSLLLAVSIGDNRLTLLVSSWKFPWLEKDARAKPIIRSNNDYVSSSSCSLKMVVHTLRFLVNTALTTLR